MTHHPWRYERAQDLLEERLANDSFRCDRCSLLNPLPARVQDGHRLCRRCWDVMSPHEAQEALAEGAERAGARPMVSLPYGITGAFAGASSVTRISPTTLNLTKGGASGTVTLTGVNFSASDTVAASNANITVSKSVDSATQITLTISASGATPAGDHSLTFNGDTLTPRGILKVR